MNCMKRLIVVICLIAVSSIISSAQETEKENGLNVFEIGVGLNISNAFEVYGGPKTGLGPGAYFEYRYKLSQCFDVGGQALYKYSKGKEYVFPIDEPAPDAVSHHVGLKALADYNFCPDRLANPYIGLSVGFGGMFLQDSYTARANYFYRTFGPRVGVQIKRFRLGVEADFACYNVGRGSRNFFRSFEVSTGINLGFCF